METYEQIMSGYHDVSYAVPISRPEITPEDVRAVNDVLLSGRLANGPLADHFARKFAEWHGFENGVAFANGTLGLKAAYRIFGDGGSVDLPSFTFSATRNAAMGEFGSTFETEPKILTYSGGSMVSIRPGSPESGATNRVSVSIFGAYPAQSKRSLREFTILDMCELVGAHGIGKSVGPGIPCVFSFFPNKQLTTGEGAVLCWNGPAEPASGKLCAYRSHGCAGATNARMSEIHAALGLSQLERLGDKINRRREAAEEYIRSMRGFSDFFLMSGWAESGTESPFSFFLLFYSPEDRDAVAWELERRRVQTRQYFSVPNAANDETTAQMIFNRILHVPFYDTIPHEHIREVWRGVGHGLSGRAEPRKVVWESLARSL